MKMMKYSLEDLLEKEKPLFLVLENLQDPGISGRSFEQERVQESMVLS